MRYQMVPVKNVSRLSEAGHALLNRAPGMPGLGLVYGETGYGKTTAVTWFVNQCRGVYVRALATWSPAAMLGSILKELDLAPRLVSCSRMTEQIIEELAVSGRPLFVDEADYIVDNKKMTETLRDLHDMASVPVVLIGMAGIQRKISLRQQFSGRIAQWVEFKPCDMADARALARALCEVEVEEDLLSHLQHAASGSARLLVVGLARIEQSAKVRGLTKIGPDQWKRGDDFFLGDAPRSHKGKA